MLDEGAPRLVKHLHWRGEMVFIHNFWGGKSKIAASERNEGKIDEFVRPFPRVVRLEPAGACNLKCSHCPTGTVKMNRGVMGAETFDLIVSNVRANRHKVKVAVLYHGGEPLLNERFPQMAKQIKALGIPLVKTVSNGMLLNQRFIADIVESGLDMIEFSLDGESPSENDFFRRKADYHSVVSNVKRLIHYKRECKSKTPQVYIASTQFISRHAFQIESKEIPPPKYLVKEFSGVYSGEIAGFKTTYAIRWPDMRILDEIYELHEDPCDRQSRNFCDHVENTITVRWNGDIVPCCYDLTSQCVLGNIHQADLATIWNNRQYLRLRLSIREMNFMPLCDKCAVVKPKTFLVPREECLAVLR